MASSRKSKKSYTTIDLRPNQVASFARTTSILDNHHAVINVGVPGTGKTFENMKWIQNLLSAFRDEKTDVPRMRLMVVVPSDTVGDVWRSLAQASGVSIIRIITYTALGTLKKGMSALLKEVTTSEPDTDNDSDEEKKTKKSKKKTFRTTKAWKKELDSGLFLVFDEAHNLKNDSNQSRAAIALCEPIFESSSRFALLSGSLFDKESLSEQFFKIIGAMKAKKAITRGDKIGTSDLTGLKEVVKYCKGLDKEKTKALVEQHGLQKDTHKQLMYELFLTVVLQAIGTASSPPVIESKKDAANGMYILAEKSTERLKKAVKELASAARVDEETGERTGKKGIALKKITKALEKIESIKIPLFISRAKSVLSTNENAKVIITLNYLKDVDDIAEALEDAGYKVLIATGEVDGTERSNIIEKFQRHNNKYRVIICTRVFGVGVSLHDKSEGGIFPRTILISPDYNLISIYQTSLRVYRDGTTSTATIRIIYARDSKELNVLNSLAKKSMVVIDLLKAIQAVLPELVIDPDVSRLPGQYDEEVEINPNVYEKHEFDMKALAAEEAKLKSERKKGRRSKKSAEDDTSDGEKKKPKKAGSTRKATGTKKPAASETDTDEDEPVKKKKPTKKKPVASDTDTDEDEPVKKKKPTKKPTKKKPAVDTDTDTDEDEPVKKKPAETKKQSSDKITAALEKIKRLTLLNDVKAVADNYKISSADMVDILRASNRVDMTDKKLLLRIKLASIKSAIHHILEKLGREDITDQVSDVIIPTIDWDAGGISYSMMEEVLESIDSKLSDTKYLKALRVELDVEESGSLRTKKVDSIATALEEIKRPELLDDVKKLATNYELSSTDLVSIIRSINKDTLTNANTQVLNRIRQASIEAAVYKVLKETGHENIVGQVVGILRVNIASMKEIRKILDPVSAIPKLSDTKYISTLKAQLGIAEPTPTRIIGGDLEELNEPPSAIRYPSAAFQENKS